MRLLSLCVLIGLGAGSIAAEQTGSRADTGTDAPVVQKKRVVVRVGADPEAERYEVVFVDHADGEPLLLDSFLADRGYLGVSLLELTPDLRRHFGAGANAGVMISRVEGHSPAFVAGLQPGDLLLSIDGEPVSTAVDVIHLVAQGAEGQIVELGILRDRREETVRATLAATTRHQLDLGGLIKLPRRSLESHGPPEWLSDSLPSVELDPESMARALSLMREHLESPGWRDRALHLDRGRAELEARIRALETRLEELEAELSELEP